MDRLLADIGHQATPGLSWRCSSALRVRHHRQVPAMPRFGEEVSVGRALPGTAD
jgi:hypothetical protein